MYLLAAAYGAYFLAWSVLGLRATPRDFAHLFAWSPAPFYLIGRALSAAANAAAVGLVWAAAGRVCGPRAGLWAAALLAASPGALDLAWAVKPDSLMLALSAGAWLAAVRALESRRRPPLLLCATLTGLAVSTQYTAAPLAAVPALVVLLSARGRGAMAAARELALAAVASAAAFAAGSPFALLARDTLMRDLGDHATVNFHSFPVGFGALSQLGRFGGAAWPLAAALAAIGTLSVARRDRRLALLLALPPLLHALTLTTASTGMLERYFFASVPALAVLAAAGVETAANAARLPLGSPWARAGVLAALMLPGAWRSGLEVRQRLLPDTRLAASSWIEENIPAGTVLILGEEPDNPPLKPSREFLERLLAAASKISHPKARLYELMLESHPGGGYGLYRMSREALSIDTGPEHRRFSEAARLSIPVSGGVNALRAAGVKVVVLSTAGLGRITPDFKAFMEQVYAQGKPLAEFRPEEGRLKGPLIRVFMLISRGE